MLYDEITCKKRITIPGQKKIYLVNLKPKLFALWTNFVCSVVKGFNPWNFIIPWNIQNIDQYEWVCSINRFCFYWWQCRKKCILLSSKPSNINLRFLWNKLNLSKTNIMSSSFSYKSSQSSNTEWIYSQRFIWSC